MIQNLVHFVVGLWRRVCGSHKPRETKIAPELKIPLINAVNDEDRLNPGQLRYPLQDLFAFPLKESQINLDPAVWGDLRLSLPTAYSIPDSEFTRVLSVQTSLRVLRWSVGKIDSEVRSITLYRASWNPPYFPPAISRKANDLPPTRS